MSTEVETRPDEAELILIDDQYAIELPCDIQKLWPEKVMPHGPGKWIGLKDCGHHRIMCGDCKEMYLNLLAQRAHNTCATCDRECEFIGFELVNRRRV